MQITDTMIAKLPWKPGMYILGQVTRGLYLAIYPRGRKTWQLRATIKGKAAVLTVGHWPEMSVATARRRARVLRKAIAAGEDPRQNGKIGGVVTVAAFARRWMKEVVAVRRKDPSQVQRILDRDILPAIGHLKIGAVDAADLRALVFRKKEEDRPAAAMRIRDLMYRMMDYALGLGVIARNPMVSISRMHVGRLRSRTRTLSRAELTQFFRRLPALGFKNAAALELILLTLCRKGELMNARWKHVDFEAGTWEVPAELSKSGMAHVVYLSERALGLLRTLGNTAMPLGRGSGSHGVAIPDDWYLFPHQSSATQPQGAATLNKAMARIKWGIPHFTVHDLRRTASTHLNEQGYAADVIEKALNHAVRGGVRGIYNRAQYAEERKKMLQEWADWLEGLKDV
jgi:integrase